MGPAMHPLDYRKPTDLEISAMKATTEALRIAYEAIVINVPSSAERTVALRKLHEVRMQANWAILFGSGDFSPIR